MKVIDNSAHLLAAIESRKKKLLGDIRKQHKERMDTFHAEMEEEFAKKQAAIEREHEEILAAETKRITSHYGLKQEHTLLRDQELAIDEVLALVDRSAAAKQIMARLKKEKCANVKQSGSLITAKKGDNAIEVDVEREVAHLRPKVLEKFT